MRQSELEAINKTAGHAPALAKMMHEFCERDDERRAKKDRERHAGTFKTGANPADDPYADPIVFGNG